MTITPSLNDIKTSRYAIPLFLALIAAGLAGNYFPFAILNAHFIFGSIFAMLALQFFGFGRGVVAAAVIAGYTYLAWNHPWAIVTMTAEVAVVGLLIRTRKINLVIADTLYWLFIGIPLGYLCFHVISHFPVSNTMFLMTKQAINGIANALIARLIFIGYSFRLKDSLISFREILSNLLLFFVLCTALILLTIGGKTDFTETDHRIHTSLIRDSRHVTDTLENWVEDRRVPIVNLARMAETLSPAQMQMRLEQARTCDINFLRIALIDKEGTSVAYSPLVDKKGRSNIGKNFADRPYIPMLKQKLKPMLSEVILSRFGGRDPIAIMLAPVVSRGDYDGAVGGIMNFDRIRAILKIHSTDQDILYTLLDKNDNVIISNRKDQKAMTPFSRSKGTLNRLDEGISQWIPELPFNLSTIELWGKSLYVAESTIGNLTEWKLILEQPVAPFQKKLYDRYTGKFFLLFVFLLVSLALAELLSRRIVKTTEKLSVITRDLPAKLVSDSQIAWPESAILETNHLIGNFREMAESLKAKFVENQQINESLEQRVEERTEALEKSEEKYRSLVESTQDSIYVVNRSCTYLFMNKRHLARLDVPEDNAAGKTYREFHSASDTQEFIKEVEKVFATDAPLQHEHKSHRDGKHFLRALSPIIGPDGRTEAVTVVSTDITDRVQAEEERLKLQDKLHRAQKMEAMGLLAGGVAHDLNNILSGIVSYPELLLTDLPEDNPLRRPIKIIQESGMRAADVVEDLLTIARGVATGKEALNLNTLITEYLESPEYQTLEKTHSFVKLKTEMDPDLLNMSGSPTHIKKTLMNLVVNSSEAIEGAGTVTISTINRYLDEPLKGYEDVRTGEYIVLSVSDDGSGISPQDLERIFEPFYTKKEMGRSGTGLGLAVVWNTVQDHNGYINVKSSEKGTIFELYFPVTREDVADEKEKTPLENYLGHGEKILVVDDEERQRMIASGMLTKLGYNPEAVSSGEEAIEYMKENAVDLIVLDMVMPKGINGRETYEQIIKIRPGQKAIIASGFSETEDVKIAQRLGAGKYIKKPYTLEKIGVAVKKELEK